MAFHPMRTKELQGMVRRMGAVASVFDVRSSTIGDRHFNAFREIMDLYIMAAERNILEGHDFVDNSVKLNGEDIEKLNTAFTNVFGAPPQELSGE